MNQDRPYQVAMCDAVFAAHEAGASSGFAVMPTGTGKTFSAAMLIRRMLAADPRPVLFIVHKKDLVFQTDAEFREAGLNSTIEMAGLHARSGDPLGSPDVVVASVQSLQGRRLAGWPTDYFSALIVDECHHALAPSYGAILGHFAVRLRVGLTATPDRADLRSLYPVFPTKFFEYPITVAIHGDGGADVGGWLVRPIVRKILVPIDLGEIRAKRGMDFNDGDLAERITPHVERMCREVRKQVGDRPTVVFTPDCCSAQATADVLNQLAGREVAVFVAGSGGRFGMPEFEKRERLARFERGEVQYLVNAELTFEGYNHKPIKAVVNMRPTLSRSRFAQMVGRGLRPYPAGGYDHCLVIDFDWQAGEETRELALTVDMYDRDEYADAVIELARFIERDIARKAAKQADRDAEDADVVEIDPEDVIAQAEEVFHVKARLDIKLTGAEGEYRTIELDPLGVANVLDLKLNRKHDLDKDGHNPSSPNQRGLLRHMGVDDPERLSKWGASKVIDKLKKREAEGKATPAQVKDLLAAGVEPAIARSQSAEWARQAIRDVAKATALVPRFGIPEPKASKARKGRKKSDDADTLFV